MIDLTSMIDVRNAIRLDYENSAAMFAVFDLKKSYFLVSLAFKNFVAHCAGVLGVLTWFIVTNGVLRSHFVNVFTLANSTRGEV